MTPSAFPTPSRSDGTPRVRSLAMLLAVLCAVLQPAAALEVVHSENDPRSYRALTLDNGIDVILVSDPRSDKAAASLSVDVGSGADPRDRAGLAHFLEHMLFLGTEKYPQPGEYKEFITRHGGRDNAYTAFDETNYFFEIEAGRLEPALDRFAQFFVAPRFNPDYVAREREVVNSEFLGGQKRDARRIHSARQAVMNPAHPYSTFSVGNTATLADRADSNVRDELLSFYRDHYSAERMALSVLGRESLDTLERWVRSRFSAVERRDTEELVIEVPLYRPRTLPARLDVRPEQERYSLTLSFPVPPVREHWRSKPLVHIAHLIGHEGPSSLLAELKRRGWAQGLSAGTGFDHESGATFDVSIDLTPEGFAHDAEITAMVFRALEIVGERGIERWLFEENARLAEIDFRFSETPSPTALVRTLARRQHEYPQDQVLRGPYAFDEFRPDLIRDYIGYLRPGNVLVTRVAPGLETARSSEWYDTPYTIAPIAEPLLARWRAPPETGSIDIPAPNPFIPRRLSMLTADGDELPRQRVDTPGFSLWHQKDTGFGLPRADFYLTLRSPLANDSPRHSVLTQLYVALVNDQLDSFAYPAALAGLEFRLYPHMRGLSVRISGFDDRQGVLLERILATLADPEIDPRRFEIFKAELTRELANSRDEAPYRRAMGLLRDLIARPSWTVAERLAVIGSIGASELERFVPRLLGQLEVVALSHGNVSGEQSEALAALAREALVAPATPAEVARGRIVRLRRGDRLIAGIDTEENPESALVLYLQGRDKRIATRARAGLLGQVLSAPFFEALRTEKQLGYVVSASAYPLLDSAGLVFLVQSPVAGASALQREVRSFLDGFAARLARMDETELEQHKVALIAGIMEEERQLGERSDRYWSEIDRGNFEFDTREELVDAVRAIDADDLRRYYASIATGDSRRQLAVHAERDARRSPHARDVTPSWLAEHRGLLPPP